MSESKGLFDTADKVISGSWGYAVVENDAIWIPAVMGRLGSILEELYEKTKIKKMIFSAVLNPDEFKKHLKNIKREWDEWIEAMGDWSHCIEIEYRKPFIASLPEPGKEKK